MRTTRRRSSWVRRVNSPVEPLGYTPVPVDISEFEKLEGCVTCLSVRLRAEPVTSTQ